MTQRKSTPRKVIECERFSLKNRFNTYKTFTQKWDMTMEERGVIFPQTF